ncbi:MAG: sulfurtransferase [Synechococcales cyanobacterium RU_4_20]|nr:sulfurtransferase [Synechococcales cyanobacterium RU_4_20]NJR68964.1 sulfurtransferase [Synechococcales cyanobacterium CRU_2_2]
MHPVVSVGWLAQQLADQGLGNDEDHGGHHGDLVICDCRFALADGGLGRSQYHHQHIPGAHYLSLDQDLSGPVQRHGGRHPLPDLESFTAKLSSLGIGPNTTVIAYDDSRLAFAARLWWLLRHYLGHEQVAVLDGGWSAWVAASLPTTAQLPEWSGVVSVATPEAGSGTASGICLVPRSTPHRWVTIAQVKSRPATTILVDSRAPDRYRGEVEPIDPIAGHIPGAVNAFWQDVTDEQGFVLSAAGQGDRWRRVDEAILPNAAANPAHAPANVIVYCGSGVTACVNLLSLELAGITHARLYAGSWSDWCSYAEDCSQALES